MLYALVFELVACNDGYLPANTGKLTHGLFFNIISSVDPAIATALHERKDRQPFSVSPLTHPRMKMARSHQVKAGHTFEMRVTLLNDPLFDSVVRYFMEGRKLPLLHISKIDLEVLSIHMTEGGHPGAGHATHESLLKRWLSPSPQPDYVTLHFDSPTTISRGTNANTRRRAYWLFPEPVAVWHNLRRQWGYTGGDEPGKDFDRWIEDHIEVVSHNLRTHMLDFHSFQQRGFTGKATFRCVANPKFEDHAFWLALSDFSFYAGIGYKTSAGLGQVIPEIHEVEADGTT